MEDIKILEEFIDGLKQYNPKTGKYIKPTQFGEGQRYVYSNVYYAIEHILSDYKRVLKENEELKQDRNNNYQMIALAQNEALGYMQGYEDGKKLKRSAVANIVENQQYYIIKKQIEKYETYIEQLRKELGQKDKIIDLMSEQLTTPVHDKEYVKQYFENKAKERR